MKYCPCHGNSHAKHVLMWMPGKDILKCNACGREFDQFMIPTHPPPSRKQWEEKFNHLYGWNPKRIEEHDSLIDGVESYLDHK